MLLIKCAQKAHRPIYHFVHCILVQQISDFSSSFCEIYVVENCQDIPCQIDFLNLWTAISQKSVHIVIWLLILVQRCLAKISTQSHLQRTLTENQELCTMIRSLENPNFPCDQVQLLADCRKGPERHEERIGFYADYYDH